MRYISFFETLPRSYRTFGSKHPGFFKTSFFLCFLVELKNFFKTLTKGNLYFIQSRLDRTPSCKFLKSPFSKTESNAASTVATVATVSRSALNPALSLVAGKGRSESVEASCPTFPRALFSRFRSRLQPRPAIFNPSRLSSLSIQARSLRKLLKPLGFRTCEFLV